jgi:hypothetical protein
MTDTTTMTALTATTRLPRPHRDGWMPSRAALAARSWGIIEELPDGSAERFRAVKAHFAEFAPQRCHGVCRLRTVE